MVYNDEALLTPEEYAKMAKAYRQELNLDEGKDERLINEIMESLHLVKGSLLSLAGFLGTGALLTLSEQHFIKLSSLFGRDFIFQPKHFSRDKTKCFLNMLGLENLLLNKLASLAGNPLYSKEILEIIKERTNVSSSLYKVNGVISAYFV